MLPMARTPSIRPSVLARYADIQPNYWPIIEGKQQRIDTALRLG